MWCKQAIGGPPFQPHVKADALAHDPRNDVVSSVEWASQGHPFWLLAHMGGGVAETIHFLNRKRKQYYSTKKKYIYQLTVLT